METSQAKAIQPAKKKKGQFLLRQKRLAKLLVEDGGKTPIGKLMIKAGYAKQYAEQPQKLKRTASWAELMEKHLPDSLLTAKHEELINASVLQHFEFPFDISDEDIKKEIEVSGIRLHKITVYENSYKNKKGEVKVTKYKRAAYLLPLHDQQRLALDMAYKLKSKYAPEKGGDSTTIIVGFNFVVPKKDDTREDAGHQANA